MVIFILRTPGERLYISSKTAIEEYNEDSLFLNKTSLGSFLTNKREDSAQVQIPLDNLCL